MIKLILTDMDGTFLNDDGDFNRTLYRSVKQVMEEKNVVFAPVTGKQCERVEEIFGSDSDDLYILGDSATRIKHKGEFVYESLLDNRLGLEIIQTLEAVSSDITIIACTRSGAVIKNSIPESEKAIVRRSYRKVIEVDDLNTVSDDFVKITVHDPLLNCFETKEKLSSFFEKAYVVASEAAWIDIADKDVHKGTTVENLQKLLDVSPEETMAFGDGYNDLELLTRAKYSFAVRNAVDALKDNAAFITGYNHQDAVMHTIHDILMLQSHERN